MGAIGVAVSTDELRGPISKLRTMLFTIATIACLLGAAGGFLYGRSLGLRLSVLSEAASRMSLGELSTPVKDPAVSETQEALAFIGRDEITLLAGQLDQARESFRLAIERLRKR
jgi:HAMP domain-containing protein